MNRLIDHHDRSESAGPEAGYRLQGKCTVGRGLSGLEQVLIGSVAESVLRRCEIPLLAVPSSQSDD